MITAKMAFDRDELLTWHLENTLGLADVVLKNGEVLRIKTLNAAEYLSVTLSNRFFDENKHEKMVLVYHIKGHYAHCTFVFRDKLSWRMEYALAQTFDKREDFKSARMSYDLYNSPVCFI